MPGRTETSSEGGCLMILGLAEETRMVAQTAEKFARAELGSLSNEEDPDFPTDQLATASEIGLLHCSAPEEAGGIELDLLGQTLLLAELAEGSAGFAAIVATHLTGLTTATESLAEELSLLLGADNEPMLIGLGLPEWTAGGATIADGVITGSLICPLHPKLCRWMVLEAPTTDTGWQRVLCEADSLVEQSEPSYCGTGLEELPRARIRLAGARFEKTLNPGGPKIASLYKLLLSAVAVGNARRALFEAVEYAKERIQTGRPIIEHQNVRSMAIASEIELRAAESFVVRAATDGSVSTGHMDLYRQAFLHAGSVGEAVCLDAVQIHGGYGYMRDYCLERRLRDSKTLQALVGDHLFDAMGIEPYTKGS